MRAAVRAVSSALRLFAPRLSERCDHGGPLAFGTGEVAGAPPADSGDESGPTSGERGDGTSTRSDGRPETRGPPARTADGATVVGPLRGSGASRAWRAHRTRAARAPDTGTIVPGVPEGAFRTARHRPAADGERRPRRERPGSPVRSGRWGIEGPARSGRVIRRPVGAPARAGRSGSLPRHRRDPAGTRAKGSRATAASPAAPAYPWARTTSGSAQRLGRSRPDARTKIRCPKRRPRRQARAPRAYRPGTWGPRREPRGAECKGLAEASPTSAGSNERCGRDAAGAGASVPPGEGGDTDGRSRASTRERVGGAPARRSGRSPEETVAASDRGAPNAARAGPRAAPSGSRPLPVRSAGPGSAVAARLVDRVPQSWRRARGADARRAPEVAFSTSSALGVPVSEGTGHGPLPVPDRSDRCAARRRVGRRDGDAARAGQGGVCPNGPGIEGLVDCVCGSRRRADPLRAPVRNGNETGGFDGPHRSAPRGRRPVLGREPRCPRETEPRGSGSGPVGSGCRPTSARRPGGPGSPAARSGAAPDRRGGPPGGSRWRGRLLGRRSVPHLEGDPGSRQDGRSAEAAMGFDRSRYGSDNDPWSHPRSVHPAPRSRSHRLREARRPRSRATIRVGSGERVGRWSRPRGRGGRPLGPRAGPREEPGATRTGRRPAGAPSRGRTLEGRGGTRFAARRMRCAADAVPGGRGPRADRCDRCPERRSVPDLGLSCGATGTPCSGAPEGASRPSAASRRRSLRPGAATGLRAAPAASRRRRLGGTRRRPRLRCSPRFGRGSTFRGASGRFSPAPGRLVRSTGLLGAWAREGPDRRHPKGCLRASELVRGLPRRGTTGGGRADRSRYRSPARRSISSRPGSRDRPRAGRGLGAAPPSEPVRRRRHAVFAPGVPSLPRGITRAGCGAGGCSTLPARPDGADPPIRAPASIVLRSRPGMAIGSTRSRYRPADGGRPGRRAGLPADRHPSRRRSGAALAGQGARFAFRGGARSRVIGKSLRCRACARAIGRPREATARLLALSTDGPADRDRRRPWSDRRRARP